VRKLKIFILSFAILVGITIFESNGKADVVYKIGAETNYAPFNYVEKGLHVGFDYDLMNEIAIQQGFKIEWEFDTFENITSGVKSGKLDGVMSGFLVSDIREESFDFSDSYIEHGSVFAVRDDEKEIKTMNDLQDKKVGVMNHTQSQYYVREHEHLNRWQTVTYENSDELLTALKDGKVDAIFNATPVVNHQLFKHTGFRLVKMDTDEQIRSQVAFAVKRGKNRFLLSDFNKGLSVLEKNGKRDRIAARYFHTDISRSNIVLPLTDNPRPIFPIVATVLIGLGILGMIIVRFKRI
jgi:polar amino acid transport system substrate-binding protein